MSNKPNIDRKPKWANFLAQDEAGIWVWFELEPKPQFGGSGYWASEGMFANVIESRNLDWYKTLEKV